MPNMGSTLKGEIKEKHHTDCSYCKPLLDAEATHGQAIIVLTAATSSESRNILRQQIHTVILQKKSQIQYGSMWGLCPSLNC